MRTLTYDDMHTAGEPVRIVTGGYPEVTGDTILDKRRQAKEQYDHLRRILMWEPRGHADMYGVIPVTPSHPDAAFGVLFMHHEGYSTMCGHATIALGRWAIETGRVAAQEPVTRFNIEAPCGLLKLAVDVKDGKPARTRFESVPAFVFARDLAVDVPGFGKVVTDIAYGGAFYAILPASAFGLDFAKAEVAKLVDAAAALSEAIRTRVAITHPEAADLGFLYGTIVTDATASPEGSHNLCVFADRQIDRSPTGSGVTARMALAFAKGEVGLGAQRVFRGISGEPFAGRVVAETTAGDHAAVIVEIAGQGYWSGEGSVIVEEEDPLGGGFELATRFADLPAR